MITIRWWYVLVAVAIGVALMAVNSFWSNLALNMAAVLNMLLASHFLRDAWKTRARSREMFDQCCAYEKALAARSAMIDGVLDEAISITDRRTH